MQCWKIGWLLCVGNTWTFFRHFEFIFEVGETERDSTFLLWSQCDELVEYGASIGETPAAVIKKCKNTIAMLSDPAAALSVKRTFLGFGV